MGQQRNLTPVAGGFVTAIRINFFYSLFSGVERPPPSAPYFGIISKYSGGEIRFQV
jgi:hypothetical protein